MYKKIKKKKKKTKETKLIFEVVYLGMVEVISLKFGVGNTDVGGHVHSKHHLVLYRQHRTTDVRKSHFLSSCQYTHGVTCWLLELYDTLPCVLILNKVGIGKKSYGFVKFAL